MTAEAPHRAGPEWTAEHVVGVEEAGTLIAAQFPFLRSASVELLGVGWDNTVYAVDGTWVFRFPRRAIAVPCVRREIAVLPHLAPRVPLPIPVPELIGAPSSAYPWPFWGARLLPGRELSEVSPPDHARTALGTAVGEFLAELHRADLVTALKDALPIDPLRRGDPSLRAPMGRERLDRLARRGLWEPDPAVTELFTEAEVLGPSTAEPVIAHGDLHIRHLLLDDQGRATGVIDWGDVCLADPAVDLAFAYSAFSGPARDALFASYGSIDHKRELRARVLAVMLSAVLADYAATESLPALQREALDGISRAVAF
jgi:aminoglycoside phosphotransferase (APT) family kinase protein